MDPRHHRGRRAEQQVCTYLQRQGLELLTRNYRCRQGEVDLVMRHADSIVFIEVRYRHRQHYGSAAESVDWHKQQKLIHCASYFLQQHPRLARLPARFDVAAVSPGPAEDRPCIHWIQDAFPA